MRKILLILIIVLLIGLGYASLANGIQISKLQILSIEQIGEQNTNLINKIEEVNNLINISYPKKYSDLKTASTTLQNARTEYFKYTNLSSDEEIINAMQEKSYAIEFLWTRIGNHATAEGVNLKLEIASSSTGANNANDLNFTLNGSYIAITNFIYAIENDTELNFRIYNFKLLPYQDNILQGTFTVRNIGIQGNTSNQSVTNQGTSNSTTNNTDTTNTINTNVTE